MIDVVREAARYLLHVRLRHDFYVSRAEEHGPDEEMWRSLISWQQERLASAEHNWRETVGHHGVPDRRTVMDALRIAVQDIEESDVLHNHRLNKFIHQFLAEFDPTILTSAEMPDGRR